MATTSNRGRAVAGYLAGTLDELIRAVLLALARAVRLVCSYANNADDAWELCMALGLNPRDGRLRATTPGTPEVRGRPSIRAPLTTTSSRRPAGPSPGSPSVDSDTVALRRGRGENVAGY